MNPAGRAGMFRAASTLMLSSGVALLLCACASGPVPPDWQANAHAALQAYESAVYAGNVRVAEAEFARARGELARTGRPELVARAELTRCAMRTLGLEFDDCPGYLALAADVGAAERTYANYLVGRWEGMQAGLLSAEHQSVVSGGAGALGAIADPRARLVAAGVLFRMGRLPATGVALAVDTASVQGWRRPLLVWLGVQLKLAEQSGDTEAAARIRRRIELTGGTR